MMPSSLRISTNFSIEWMLPGFTLFGRSTTAMYLPSSQKKGLFWWRDILKLLDSFKGMSMVNFQDGASCLFWEDLWLHKVPKHSYPKLFSFAKNPWISLKHAKEEELDNLLYLLISNIALQQLVVLAQDLSSLPDMFEHDTWSYIWGSPHSSPQKHMYILQVIE